MLGRLARRGAAVIAAMEHRSRVFIHGGKVNRPRFGPPYTTIRKSISDLISNGIRVGNGAGDMDSGLRMPGNRFPDALDV